MKEIKQAFIVFMIPIVGAFVRPPLLESINPSVSVHPLYIENVNVNVINKPPDKTSSEPSGSPASHRKFLEFPRFNYVDKTLFIRDALKLYLDLPASFKSPSILITRPRGFGKTLALSSLYYYCDHSLKNATALFSGLKVMEKSPDLNAVREKYMSKFPVIWVDFGTVQYKTLDQNFEEIKRIINNIFREHQYLVDSDKLSPSLRNRFQQLLRKSGRYSSFKSSIQLLSECIHEYNKKVPIILIDNYDVPFHTGYKYNYYKEIEEFMWSFYYHTMQENNFVHRVFLTGVTQIHDPSFYMLENVHVFTVLDYTFCKDFGFTGEEVKELLRRSESNIRFQTLEYQYGGYLYGNLSIFNPLSVVTEIFSHKLYAWAKAEPSEPGKVLVGNGLYPVLTIQNIIDGKSVEKNLAEYLHLPELKNRELTYWTYLIHSGYVTATRVSEEFKSDNFRLSIPNLEVRQKIESLIKEAGKKIPDNKKFTDQLIHGDYAHAQYFICNYTREAGKYFWSGHEYGFLDEFLTYVKLMLRGVENRFNTTVSVDSSGYRKYTLYMESQREVAAPIVIRFDKGSDNRNKDYIKSLVSEAKVGKELLIMIEGKKVHIYAGTDILSCKEPLEKKQQ